jgi:hypothetical protein
MFHKSPIIAAAGVVIAGCLGAATGSGAPSGVQQPAAPPNATLNVTLRPQLTNMWCWAASGQMVMEFLGRNIPQCTQANARFGLANCCGSSTPSPCVKGGWPEFYKWGFTSQHTNSTALTDAQLRDQIGVKKKPVAFSWAWTGGGGHMMVVVGYSTAGGQSYVSINDPWPPPSGSHPGGDRRTISYARYVSGPTYTHWDDYYDVTRSPGKDEAVDKPDDKAPKGADPSPHPAKGNGRPGDPPGKGPGAKDMAKAIEDTRPVAKAGLGTFRELAMGKKEDGPGANAELGDPFPEVFIPLDRLKAKNPGGPETLLDAGVSKVLYPVVAGDVVSGLVEVDRVGDKWEAGAYGNAALARLLTSARADHMRKSKAKASDYYTVSVPALNQYFVATKEGDRVVLISVIDDAQLGLKAGEAVDAKDVLPKLIEAAMNHDGAPR